MKHFFASAAIVTALAVPASGQDADTVLATVNGKEITLGHLIVAVDGLPQQLQELPADQLFNGLVEQMIRQEALAAGARGNLGSALQLALETQEAALIANAAISAEIDAGTTEDNLRAEYDEIYGNVEPQPEFNASHILVATEAEAASLEAQLAEGADFGELARTFSIGPSGPDGGNLGWFGIGQMVPSFEAALLELEVGEVSPPVETQFGWHVLTLNDRREISAPAFEDVRDTLRDRIAEERAISAIEAAEAAATIVRSHSEIDPDLIRNRDLVAD